MANNVSLSESFLLEANPKQIWENMFGCQPSDTDIAEGVKSSSSYAIETSLEALHKQIEPLTTLDFGECYELPIVLNKRNISLLRRKLLSAAILNQSQNTSLKGSYQKTHFQSDNGLIAVVGEFHNCMSLLSGLNLKNLDGLVTASSSDAFISNVILSNSSDYGISIELEEKETIEKRLLDILDSQLALYLKNQRINEIDILAKNDNFNFRAFLSSSDLDNRERFNKIIQYARKKIDSGDNILEEAIAHSPYKRSLVNSLYNNALSYLVNELAQYGCVLNDNNTFSTGYKSQENLKPCLYRLLGDSKFYLDSLIKREMVKTLRVFLPMGRCIPNMTLIKPTNTHMEIFTAEFQEADFVISLPEASGLQDIFSLGDGILLDEASVLDYRDISESLKKFFKDDFIN